MPYRKSGVGYQKTDTSLQSAVSVEKRAETLRERVLKAMKEARRPLATHEIADLIQSPYVSVQPRISELRRDRRVRDSGQRAMTGWGKLCIKWELVK